MASGAQQLIEAIQLLYAHPDDKVKRQAGEWLEQWQQSVEAWSMSDAVLHDRSCAVEAHYFCAQTLRTKVSLRTMNLTEAVSTLCPSSLHKVPSECSLRGLFLRCKLSHSRPSCMPAIAVSVIGLPLYPPADF